MSEKGFIRAQRTISYRDDVESGGQLIESNTESLAEGNRIVQRDKYK